MFIQLFKQPTDLMKCILLVKIWKIWNNIIFQLFCCVGYVGLSMIFCENEVSHILKGSNKSTILVSLFHFFETDITVLNNSARVGILNIESVKENLLTSHQHWWLFNDPRLSEKLDLAPYSCQQQLINLSWKLFFFRTLYNSINNNSNNSTDIRMKRW